MTPAIKADHYAGFTVMAIAKKHGLAYQTVRGVLARVGENEICAVTTPLTAPPPPDLYKSFLVVTAAKDATMFPTLGEAEAYAAGCVAAGGARPRVMAATEISLDVTN